MEKTMFSDEVVRATDLKNRQRYWFNRARETGGVTIIQGKVADLVLVPRQRVAETAETAAYARTAAQFLREVITLERPLAESAVFPWLRDLDKEEQQEFLREFVDLLACCSTIGGWERMEVLLEDWQATATAKHNPDLLEAWRSRGRADDYVSLEVGDDA